MTVIDKMKRFICFATLALVGVGVMPTSAGANSVLISGTVNGICTVSAVPTFTVTGVPNSNNPVPPTSPTTITSSITATCNKATTITIAATALRLTPAGAAALPTKNTESINYTATVTNWSTTAATVTTAETAPRATSPITTTGAAQPQPSAKTAGNVTIIATAFTLVPNGSGTKSVAGNYSATITLTITPI